jgi:prepilin-type N-terminal cleavage/methylation domain-containing protein/prepilin-type processing-associated H-X9-DG protein
MTSIVGSVPSSSSVAGAAREHQERRGFTLIELLVVVAIISLLVSILLPALSSARQQARAAMCASQLRVLGQGLTIYLNYNEDVLPPGRLPNIDSCNAYAMLETRKKYRPTFLAMMSGSVGAPPFDDPKACKGEVDIHGEKGDRQNYSCRVYVCPSVPEWTDERNGSYGYNYQFLGNSRLLDESVLTSYKRWPVKINWIRRPGETVAVGDCMGTAASWAPMDRKPYGNNTRDAQRFGDEGFNLDPPRVDPEHGEMAGAPDHRTAADPRHRGRACVLWLDGHAALYTLEELGYQVNPDGSIGFEGDNTRWSGNGLDVPWTPDFTL